MSFDSTTTFEMERIQIKLVLQVCRHLIVISKSLIYQQFAQAHKRDFIPVIRTKRERKLP